MRQYPYYIVEWWTGRLQCPPQYRMVAPIRRQFETGVIGGKNRHEETFDDEGAACLRAQRLDREGKSPDVLVVRAPNRYREHVRNWRSHRGT